jgi:biopolymer transport protein ExbD
MTAGRKLYYAPGMISLIGLFIFFNWSMQKFNPQPQTYLTINVPRENSDKSDYRYSIDGIEKQLKKKKQIQLTLDADEKTNERKFELIKYEARKLKYTQDTSTVLRIRFTNDITYGTLVRLINLCYAEGHKRFVLLKNSFVIYGEYPQANSIADTKQSYLSGVDVFNPSKESQQKTFIEKFANFIQPLSSLQFFGLLLFWLTLIIISLYYGKSK